MQVNRMNFHTLQSLQKTGVRCSDFNSKKHEDYSLLGCDTLQSGRYLSVSKEWW
jgi:hypothetical protein